MQTVQKGRANSMTIIAKDDRLKDITRVYFNHPVWLMKWGDAVPDMPLDVMLELVNRCNLACEACPIHHLTRAESYLDWETLRRIVDEAAEEGVCYFTICGVGEAALHPELFRLLGYIRAKNVVPKGLRTLPMMPSVLISNGMWTSKQVDECIANPPDLLSVSLAGLTDDEIRQRRHPIHLERFWENVARVYRERRVVREVDGGVAPVIHVSTHIYPHEIVERTEEIERFKEKWLEISDAVVIKPTMLGPNYQQYEHFANPKALASLRGSPLAYVDISERHYERTAPCFETSRRLAINSDGNVWCSHHMSEDFGPFLGNIKEQTLRQIWHGEKMNAFRRQTRAGIFDRKCCKECGGELIEHHRVPLREMEREITFQPVLNLLHRGEECCATQASG